MTRGLSHRATSQSSMVLFHEGNHPFGVPPWLWKQPYWQLDTSNTSKFCVAIIHLPPWSGADAYARPDDWARDSPPKVAVWKKDRRAPKIGFGWFWQVLRPVHWWSCGNSSKLLYMDVSHLRISQRDDSGICWKRQPCMDFAFHTFPRARGRWTGSCWTTPTTLGPGQWRLDRLEQQLRRRFVSAFAKYAASLWVKVTWRWATPTRAWLDCVLLSKASSLFPSQNAIRRKDGGTLDACCAPFSLCPEDFSKYNPCFGWI